MPTSLEEIRPALLKFKSFNLSADQKAFKDTMLGTDVLKIGEALRKEVAMANRNILAFASHAKEKADKIQLNADHRDAAIQLLDRVRELPGMSRFGLPSQEETDKLLLTVLRAAEERVAGR